MNDLTGRSAERPNEYRLLISELSTLIEEGRRLAVREVNTALMAIHWLMGKRIIDYEQKGEKRAEYGESLLRTLGASLGKKYGKGFSERNLKLMRQFYLTYPIRQSLIAESGGGLEAIGRSFPLSWTHYVCLMRIVQPEKRIFYEKLSLENRWPVRQLDREIQSLLYERTALSKRKEITLARANEKPMIVKPEDEIKDPYVLDFLGLKDDYSESELEDALIRHVERFMLELGSGFAFVGRQKRFHVGDADYRIDLLLFNRIWHALLLVDLKIGDFTHADAGQMNFYLNWAKAEAKLTGENDPVGLILCAGKNKSYVQYALGGLSNKIFVSQYRLQLPKPIELKRELERGRALFLQTQKALKGR